MKQEQSLINMRSFSDEEIRRWQEKLLEILVYFKSFCEENNLRFYLSGGTLIGAVRHKGFIPWDDDIDVIMPREDYERLYELWPQKADLSRFSCLKTTKDQCVKYPMTVIKSENTTCIYDHSQDLDISQGMKMDVEHLDGVPKDRFRAKMNWLFALLLGLFRAQRVPNHAQKYKRIISKILLWLVPTSKARYRIVLFCEKQIKKYKCAECEKVRYLSEQELKREWYDTTEYLEFEGHMMPVPGGYNEFLKVRYGDYMSLPPVEKRHPFTKNIVFYDLDTSYLKYKGSKYLTSK